MKKKIALLLAVVMLFAAAVPMNLFAASSNALSTNAFSAPGRTLFPDQRLNVTTGETNTGGTYAGASTAPSYIVSGTDLIIQINDRPLTSGAFRIELENATFAYRSLGDPGDPAGTTLNVGGTNATFSSWLEPATGTSADYTAFYGSVRTYHDLKHDLSTAVTTADTAADTAELALEVAKFKAATDAFIAYRASTGTPKLKDLDDATTKAGAILAADALIIATPVNVTTAFDTAVNAAGFIALTDAYVETGSGKIFATGAPGQGITPVTDLVAAQAKIVSLTTSLGVTVASTGIVTYWNAAFNAFAAAATTLSSDITAVPAGGTADTDAVVIVDAFLGALDLTASTSNGAIAALQTAFDEADAIATDAGNWSTDFDNDMPYTMEISRTNPKSAVVFINSSDWAKNTTDTVRIPLCIFTDNQTTNNVVARVTDTTTAVVSTSTHVLNVVGSGATTTTIDVAYGRDKIILNEMVIKENRIGSIKAQPFYLEAPLGYEWAVGPTDVEVYVETGLGGSALKTPSVVTTSYVPTLDPRDDDDYHRILKIDLSSITGASLTPSTLISGKLFVNGLVLIPKYGNDDFDEDISITINGTDFAGASFTSSTYYPTGFAGISNQTLLVGARKDWDLTLTAAKAVTMVSGFQNWQVATATMQEVVPNSWWAERYVDLILTDKDGNPLESAKISGVGFRSINPAGTQTLSSFPTTQYSTTPAAATRWSTLTYIPKAFTNPAASLTTANAGNRGRWTASGGTIANGGQMTGGATLVYDTVTGNRLTLGTWKVASGQLGYLGIYLYLSVESGWEGDVYLTAKAGSGVYADSVITATPIATVVNPVELTAKTTNVNIGYQRYTVADITITETDDGMLSRGDENYLSLIDFTNAATIMNQGIRFVPITEAKNISVPNATANRFNATFTNGTGTSAGIINFEVTRASVEAATITFKNLELNIDHTVPYGKYNLLLAGDSICDNSTDLTVVAADKNTPGKADYDRFLTRGIVFENYVNVVTAGANSNIQNNVKVVEGASTAVVNGQVVNFDYPCYISGNSFMVPIRFLTRALGLNDTTNLLWDPVAHTVTIVVDNRTVVFTENSSVMTINGAPVNMVDSTGLAIKCELTNDRIYVPFRMLGNALGISVEWHTDTATAEYNPVQ